MKRILFCALLITLSLTQTIAQDTISKVFILSSPDRATLYIDGQLTGRTPTLLEIPIGEHHFKAVRGGKKAEKNIFVSNTSQSDSSSYQQLVYLNCKRKNYSFDEYIKDGTLIITGGLLYSVKESAGFHQLAYLREYGGFIKLLKWNRIPFINGIAAGPTMHLYGPICIEAGIGYQSHYRYGTNVYLTLGTTIVFKGFSLTINYDYTPHSIDTHWLDFGIGWAFKPNMDFKHK
jgi:hypothetical protein